MGYKKITGSELSDCHSKSLKEISLKIESPDLIALIAKASFGLIPYIGSFLGEIAGNIIPNQRMDRYEKYISVLGKQLELLENASLKSLLLNNNFISLFEESSIQAVRAITDERRNYIANVVIEGIKSDHIEFAEAIHVLQLLSQINDVEIIILGSFLHRTYNGGPKYREKYPEIFKYDTIMSRKDENEKEKFDLMKSYKLHLSGLGLLSHKLELDRDHAGKVLKGRSSPISQKGFNITPSGLLVLKYVGFDLDTQ